MTTPDHAMTNGEFPGLAVRAGMRPARRLTAISSRQPSNAGNPHTRAAAEPRFRRRAARQFSKRDSHFTRRTTFRFSGVLSFLNPYYQGGQSAQLTRIDAGHWAYMPILAIVPPCAGECRLVRVTGVLIFANARTCVACVLPAAGPLGQRVGARLRTGGPGSGSKTSCRDYPSASRPSGCSWRHCRNDVP